MKQKLISMLLTVSLVLSLCVTAFAAPPTASSFAAAVPVSAQSVIHLQGADIDGTPLVYAATSAPAHGTLSNLNTATGAVIYTPAPGYTGTDSFTYTVTSGGDTSATGTVSITITSAKTRVIDAIPNPDGTPRVGKVTFILTQSSSSPGGIIPAKSSISANLNSSGQFDVSLYPSQTISPLQYYQVWFDDAVTRNTQMLGLYSIPASTTTITLLGHKVTDANLAAQFTFSSKAEVDALTAAVAAATTAQLFPYLTSGKHVVWNGVTFANSLVSESGGVVNVAGNQTVAGVLTATGGINGITNGNLPNVFENKTFRNGNITGTLAGLTSEMVPPVLSGKFLLNPALTNPTSNGGNFTDAIANNLTVNGLNIGTGNIAATNVTVTGNVGGPGAHVIGDGSALTNVGVGTSTGHSAPGSVTIMGDNSTTDGITGGIVALGTGNINSIIVNNDHSISLTNPVTGTTSYLLDKGATVYDVRSYGATPNNSTDSDTIAIQAALSAATTAGGGIVMVKGGIFDVTKNTSVTDVNACLFMGSKVTLFIDSSATLRIKSGQLTGTTTASYLHLLVLGGDNMTIAGGGRMTGNTTGQPGYSGGYTQGGSNLITGGGSNILIQNLTLDDNFGNPINLNHSDAARGKNIRILNMYTDNVGEGIQVVKADGVQMENIVARNTNSVQVGDAVEVADCVDVTWDNINFKKMVGLDIFGSKKMTASNLVGEDCNPCLEIHDFGTSVGPSEEVAVSNSIFKQVTFGDPAHQIVGVSLNSEDGSLRNIALDNVHVLGNPYTLSFLIGNPTPSAGPVSLTNCTSKGAAIGLRISTVDHVTVTGGSYSDGTSLLTGQATALGILYDGVRYATSAAQTAQLNIHGVMATSNTGYGFFLDDQGSSAFDVYAPTGSIINCNFQNNTLGPFIAGDSVASLSKLSIRNNTPREGEGHYINAAGQYELFRIVTGSNTTVPAISNPSYQQTLVLQFTEDKLIPDSAPFDLAGSGSVQFHAGQWLCLQWDGTTWHELWRRST